MRANSPIDKYYRMYVIEPDSKVYGQTGDGMLSGHLRGCPYANHNSKSSLSVSSRRKVQEDLPLPSPERQAKAIKLLEKAKNADDLFMIADMN